MSRRWKLSARLYRLDVAEAKLAGQPDRLGKHLGVMSLAKT
jgi:hypothetical protein